MNSMDANENIRQDGTTSSALNIPLNVDCTYTCEKLAVGGQIPHGLCIIMIVLFIGILLSMTLTFGISATIGSVKLCDDYYDGVEHEDIVLVSFSDVFYKSPNVRQAITKYDYLLFGNLPHSNVILGKKDFLFEIYDEANDYNFIADYIGDSVPEDKEIADLAHNITSLQDKYADIGVNCVVAVIPNIHTIYGEMMPDFFGEINSDTRLSRLTQYMVSNNMGRYIDTTDALINAKHYGRLYNNTENSLNALGAYFVYREVMEQLPQEQTRNFNILKPEDLELVSHLTNGKKLARQVGLSDIIENLTVSLSTNFTQMYKVKERRGSVQIVETSEEYSRLLPKEPAFLFEFTSENEWDRILLTDYFSNTIGLCGYRSSITFDPSAVEAVNASTVVIFVHENELSLLGSAN